MGKKLISADKLIEWIEGMRNKPMPDDSGYIDGRMTTLDLLERRIEYGSFDPDEE